MKALTHPARLVPLAFLAAIAVGTCLLMLPIASAPGETTQWLDAAFTAVSATCVTGLVTLDTPTHWSTFGKVVILLMIQVGGFGIMTLATLLALLVGGRWGLQASLVTSSETHSSLGDVRNVPKRIAVTMLAAEAVVAAVLTLRFRAAYDPDWPTALWHGVFHAVSAFNNAGFALYSDNVMSFKTDAWIVLPLCAAVVAGGLGFPVYFELTRRWQLFRYRLWSVHARLTIIGTVVLLVVGFVAFLVVEWRNHLTIGDLTVWQKLVNGVAGSVFPRTAGFQTVDYELVRPETLLVHYALMFIGGGSAGTAGGIKVGTFFLLAYVIWSEVRGEPDVVIGHRRIGGETMRQALAVSLLAIGLIALGTFVILSATHFRLDVVLFETISAFGTVGLSTNLTPFMPPIGKVVLMVLMFCGRVGPISAVAAMAVTRRTHRYRLPKEQPIVG
ncbi:TrkH family potassium uptake protein [Mariniluteicoccus flavus]